MYVRCEREGWASPAHGHCPYIRDNTHTQTPHSAPHINILTHTHPNKHQEIGADFLLRKYSVLLLDEAHERNLNTDVLLGLLSRAIPLR